MLVLPRAQTLPLTTFLAQRDENPPPPTMNGYLRLFFSFLRTGFLRQEMRGCKVANHLQIFKLRTGARRSATHG